MHGTRPLDAHGCSPRLGFFRHWYVADALDDKGRPYAFGSAVLLFGDARQNKERIHITVFRKLYICVEIVAHKYRPAQVNVVK